VLANAPHGAFDLKGHLSRIWLLGGVDTPGAGTTHNATTIFYTNPIVSGGGTASADWKDPVTGLTNQVVMDRDISNYGVALATVRGGLLVLRRASVHLLRGTTSANFSVSTVTTEVGCLDARSVIEADGQVYFMSTRGLMMTDGVRVVNMSGNVMYTLQQAVAAQQTAVVNSTGGYISCGQTSEGSILISIGAYSNSGNVRPLWCALYDPSLKVWTRITSRLWTNDGTTTTTSSQVIPNLYPGMLFSQRSPKQLLAIGDRYVTILEDLNLGLSFLHGSELYDLASTNVALGIPALWSAKYPPIVGSATRKLGQAKRYFLDYAFAAAGLVGSIGFTVTPSDASGAPYASVMQCLAGTPPVPESITGVPTQVIPPIQRQSLDFVNEVSDVTFTVSWTAAQAVFATAETVADVFGIGIEFQPGRDLR
jgi:hypothetical protein